MTESNNSYPKEEKRLSMQDRRQHAQELIDMAKADADALFDQGDLTPYLDILSRFHNYNYYNLLLILRQYPQATCLAPFSVWLAMVGQNKMALRDEWIGRGIELVAPHSTLNREKGLFLSWFPAKQFDISQTWVTDFKVPESPYHGDRNLLRNLCYAIRGALAREYQVTLVPERRVAMQSMEITLPGRILENGRIVTMRSDLSPEYSLLWLTEALILSTDPCNVLNKEYLRLFITLAQNCLFRIWGLADSDPFRLRSNPDILYEMPSDTRYNLLDLLQCRVRYLDESIRCEYLAMRSQEPHLTGTAQLELDVSLLDQLYDSTQYGNGSEST